MRARLLHNFFNIKYLNSHLHIRRSLHDNKLPLDNGPPVRKPPQPEKASVPVWELLELVLLGIFGFKALSAIGKDSKENKEKVIQANTRQVKA